MTQKEYAKAAEVLVNFISRSKKEFAPKTPDPRGYHHPEIYFALGNCRLLQEKFSDAAAAYQKTLARDPAHVGAWLNLAKAHYELKDPYKAAHCFEKGYAAAPEKNPEHLYFAACAYLMAENYARAIDIFNQLIQSHRESIKPAWRENHVHALLAAQRPEEALPIIEFLADAYTGKKQIQWQEILLSQYLLLNKDKKALAFAVKLTRKAPTFAKWWKAMAHVQLNLGKNEEALCALMIYGYLTPLTLEEERLLADLNLQLGIPAKAAPRYEKLMAKKPDKTIAAHLARAYQQQGQTEKALAQLEEFNKSAADYELLMLEGDLLYALEKYHRAAQKYRKAGKMKDAEGRAWLMAGYAAWQAEDIDQSRKAFLLAAHDPAHKSAAREALRQLK